MKIKEIKSKEKEIQNLKTQAETNSFKAQINQINLDRSRTKKSFLMEKDFQCDHLEEIKKLKIEEERIWNEINNIMFVNEFSPAEKDELTTRINELVNNQIKVDEYCNQ